MNTSSLLFGLLPLLLFVIIDSFAGMKAALISAIIICCAEAAFTYFTFGELDAISIASLILILILALASYRFRSPLYFKFQPVILSLIFGLWFLFTSLFQDQSLLISLMFKYQNHLPPLAKEKLHNPLFVRLLDLSTFYCGLAFLFHAAVTAYAAIKMSNWWWIAVRGIGFYFFFILAFLLANIHVRIL